MIRNAKKQDAAAICKIYNHYVVNSIITFEEQPVNIEEMQRRIQEVTKSLPWLVYEDSGEIQGYAYATKWKSRSAYRNSVESTVYLLDSSIGKGIGRALYTEIIKWLQKHSFHCVIGGIALPNPKSIILHEKMGFEKVAHFKEVGWKKERWIDVAYYELTL